MKKLHNHQLKNFRNHPAGSILIIGSRPDQALIRKTVNTAAFKGDIFYREPSATHSLALPELKTVLNRIDSVIFTSRSISRIPNHSRLEMVALFSWLASIRGKSGLYFVRATRINQLDQAMQSVADTYQIAGSSDWNAQLTTAFQSLQQSSLIRRTTSANLVPHYLWQLPHFQNWYQAQTQAGNELLDIVPRLNFHVGADQQYLLYWAAQVHIKVAAENGRIKSNEIVISRPDIQQVVAYHQSKTNILNSEFVLIREFRSTASTKDGFVREVPGGSGINNEQPELHAANEFTEETGWAFDPARLVPLGTRQISATTSAHQAQVFAIELSQAELNRFKKLGVSGNHAESEITYPEVKTLKQLLKQPLTDWANLGMVMSALLSPD